ncbi:MAG: hypothetical protein RIS36_1239 [Pseudomonadota bacterium]|jgi:hypothetical protein
MKLISLFLIVSFVAACDSSFAETTTFNCEYLLYSDPNGRHEENPPLSFSLLLDSNTKKAYLLGNNGASEIVYRANGDRLTFLEETATGNLLVTVVARDGQSVHSRHPFVGDKFLATQYYGRCAKK